MANGGKAFGVELLSAQGCARALEPQTASPNANTLFWGGAGGSTVMVDTDAHLCFSYVMNEMDNIIIGGPRGQALSTAIYESLAEL